MKLIDQKKLNEITSSIYYLHIAELKEICNLLNILAVGDKEYLAKNILSFIGQGIQKAKLTLPNSSKAKPHTNYPLTPDALMLKGDFKNTGKHKDFLQKLIGSNYKTKVAAIDWLNQRWLNGNPPTYLEYAEYYKTIANKPLQEKQTLRLNNFTRNYSKQYPSATMPEIMAKWEALRLQNKQITFKIINNFIANNNLRLL